MMGKEGGCGVGVLKVGAGGGVGTRQVYAGLTMQNIANLWV